MSPLKLPIDLARRLHEMGINARGYQPVTHFIKNNRKLPNAAEPGDPWHIVLRRNDRVIWADGAHVVEAVGPTVREAVEMAIAAIPKTGLLDRMSVLGQAVDKLTEALRAR